MIACLLAVGLTAFTFTSVVPNGINKYYNQGLTDVTYDYEKYGDDDSITDNIVYTIPNNFGGILQENVSFSSDAGIIEYSSFNDIQQFNENYDTGINSEVQQYLYAYRNDFYVSISNPCMQSFALTHNSVAHSVYYTIDVEYEYMIPGYMTSNTWYNAVVYDDTISIASSQTSGVVYPIYWFIDNLDKDVSTIYNLIHIKSFKLTMESFYDNSSNFDTGFIIDNDYSLSDLQLSYVSDWFDTYSYGVSVEPLPVVDFTSWISYSITSFWNFYIFPGVSIGIIFSTIVALVVITIILKMFLGG